MSLGIYTKFERLCSLNICDRGCIVTTFIRAVYAYVTWWNLLIHSHDWMMGNISWNPTLHLKFRLGIVEVGAQSWWYKTGGTVFWSLINPQHFWPDCVYRISAEHLFLFIKCTCPFHIPIVAKYLMIRCTVSLKTPCTSLLIIRFKCFVVCKLDAIDKSITIVCNTDNSLFDHRYTNHKYPFRWIRPFLVYSRCRWNYGGQLR